MNRTTIFTILVLAGLVSNPASSLFAYCPQMRGYSSFAAMNRAKAKARTERRWVLVPQSRSSAPQARAVSSPPRPARPPRDETIVADQTELKRLGYYKGDIDGRPGAALERSIAEFRAVNRLGPGTKLDASSRTLLRSGNAVKRDSGMLFSRQAERDQRALLNLGYYRGPLDGKSATQATKSAVKEFRRVRGLGEGTGLDMISRAELYAYFSSL